MIWYALCLARPSNVACTHQVLLRLDCLVPFGFLFIWIPAQLQFDVLLKLESLRFQHVESLVWVKMNVNNRINQEMLDKYKGDKKPFLASKETLHIFRRLAPDGKWYRHDMRHQRSSDVCLNFCRTDAGESTFLVCFSMEMLQAETNERLFPDEHVMKVVETMLPPIDEKGQERRYLYMFAPQKRGVEFVSVCWTVMKPTRCAIQTRNGPLSVTVLRSV